MHVGDITPAGIAQLRDVGGLTEVVFGRDYGSYNVSGGCSNGFYSRGTKKPPGACKSCGWSIPRIWLALAFNLDLTLELIPRSISQMRRFAAAGVTDGHLAALPLLPSLQSLRLTNAPALSDAGFQPFSTLTALRQLEVSQCVSVSSEMLPRLALPRLARLKIFHCGHIDRLALLAQVGLRMLSRKLWY